jgi:predicted 2-oxoglutarate/Fe(II)-dependent dioxygenase YbiX
MAHVESVDTRLHIVRQAITARRCERIIDANREHARPHRPRGGGSLLARPTERREWLCGAADIIAAAARRAAYLHAWPIKFDIVRYGCSGYEVGDYMSLHVDDEERLDPPWDLAHRGVSVSLQLSPPDAYEGGDLIVAGSLAPREQGTLIAFGSSVEHEVTEVTLGGRWVALGWAYCNHDRRGLK